MVEYIKIFMSYISLCQKQNLVDDYKLFDQLSGFETSVK